MSAGIIYFDFGTSYLKLELWWGSLET